MKEIKLNTLGFLVIAMVFAAVLVNSPREAHALLILDDMVYINGKSGAATFKVKNTSKIPQAYKITFCCGWV